MKALNAILDQLPNTKAPVTNVCTGAFWTSVSTTYTGLSTTYREMDQQHADKPSMVKNAGTLTDLTAKQLAAYALSSNTVGASIGMATINSALNINEDACTNLNASDVIAARADQANIAIIGHFPFAKKLAPLAGNLWIIERKDRPGTLPEAEAETVLPRCDIVCITGTTLINHSFERLISLCRKQTYVVLTGPTSPLTPLLFEYGVDAICGCRVDEPSFVNQYITQGATFRQLKRTGVKLLTMEKDSYTP